MKSIKPQILCAMMVIGILAGMVILVAPEHITEVVGAAVTGVGMLGMKLLEK